MPRGGATGGSAGPAGPPPPAPPLPARLRDELGAEASPATVASLDVLHQSGSPEAAEYAGRVDAAGMQNATLLAPAEARGMASAAIWVVTESASGEQASDEQLEAAAKRAGSAAFSILSG